MAWLVFCDVEAITDPCLMGDSTRVELAAEWSVSKPKPVPNAEPHLEVPVEVMPRRSKVGDRSFSTTPTSTRRLTARDMTAIERIMMPIPRLKPRPRDTAATDQVDPRPLSQRMLPQRRDTDQSPVAPEIQSEQASIARRSRTVGTAPDRLPRLLSNLPPEYPSQAKERRLEGRVVLGVRVSSTGRVEAIDILTASGHEILDVAAVRAVWAWQFEPAVRSGYPAAATIHLPIRFSLD